MLQSSTTAPVVLVFHSPSQAPESSQMAEDVADIVGQYDGRYLVGLVDVDAVPQIAQVIAQASQLPQLPVPLLMVFLDGRPAIQPIPGMVSREELSTLFNELGQQLTAQGITGRHQPLATAAPAEGDDGTRSPAPTRATRPRRTRWRPVTSTRPSRSTRSWSTATPPTPRPLPAWRWRRCCSGPRASTSTRPERPRPRRPTTSTRRSWSPTSTCSAGMSRTAFARLVELVRRTSDKERDRAREHLLGLFAAVGNEDPRVLKGRQALASALY